MKSKDIKHRLAVCRKEIEQCQHSEYIEAYLCDVNRALTEGLESGALKLKNREDFTNEEWQEMIKTAYRG